MRIALAVFLALHGAIHLIGVSRAHALLWLAATVALLAAAALLVAGHELWWAPALAGVLLSQVAIASAWHEARFGTIANVLIVLLALVAAAHTLFARRIDVEIEALRARAVSPGGVVAAADVASLPPPVRRWLEASGVVGRPRARIIELEQRGAIRTEPDGAWMPARAAQVFTVEPPGFVWRVDATMKGVIPVAGRDRYAAGHGNMLIKAASLVSVVDAADEKIDRGSLLRFLGEIVWFPSAALSPRIVWEPVDDAHARATMRDAGLTASAVFTFAPDGRVTGLRAERYLGGGADARLTPWLVTCTEWRAFGGIQVPSRGDVAWELPGGAFSYYRWEIVALEVEP